MTIATRAAARESTVETRADLQKGIDHWYRFFWTTDQPLTASSEQVGSPEFDKLVAIQALFPASHESGNQET